MLTNNAITKYKDFVSESNLNNNFCFYFPLKILYKIQQKQLIFFNEKFPVKFGIIIFNLSTDRVIKNDTHTYTHTHTGNDFKPLLQSLTAVADNSG